MSHLNHAEVRRHHCCYCLCTTYQQKLYAGFGAIAWKCGECGEYVANYHDEPLWKAEQRYWDAIGGWGMTPKLSHLAALLEEDSLPPVSMRGAKHERLHHM